MNQYTEIAKHIKLHGSITSLHAMQFCGCMSLHRRLSDMRDIGYVFGSKWLDVKNRHGKNVRVKSYWIIKQPRKSK